MIISQNYVRFIRGLATMAQAVERRLGKAEVTGSSPVSSFKKKRRLGVFFVLVMTAGYCRKIVVCHTPQGGKR